MLERENEFNEKFGILNEANEPEKPTQLDPTVDIFYDGVDSSTKMEMVSSYWMISHEPEALKEGDVPEVLLYQELMDTMYDH